jgi:hypothetical protein
MKFMLAAVAVLTFASPALAAALLNHGPVTNRIYRGIQTTIRIDAGRMEHPVAFVVGQAAWAKKVRAPIGCRGARVAATPPAAVRMPIAA